MWHKVSHKPIRRRVRDCKSFRSFEKIGVKLHISFPSACGWVQICDLANESHAKDVQENEHSEVWLETADCWRAFFVGYGACDIPLIYRTVRRKSPNPTNYEVLTERPGGGFLGTFAHTKVPPPRTAEWTMSYFVEICRWKSVEICIFICYNDYATLL